jgi:hypothetical protein
MYYLIVIFIKTILIGFWVSVFLLIMGCVGLVELKS